MLRYAFVALGVVMVASVASSAPASGAGKPQRPAVRRDSATEAEADFAILTVPGDDADPAATIAATETDINEPYDYSYGDFSESDDDAEVNSGPGSEAATPTASSYGAEGGADYSAESDDGDDVGIAADSPFVTGWTYDDELSSAESAVGSQEDVNDPLWSQRILLALLRTLREEAEARGEKAMRDAARKRRSVAVIATRRGGAKKSGLLPPKDPKRGSSDLAL